MKLSPFGIIALIFGMWTLLILSVWYYSKTPEKKPDVTEAVTPPAVQEQQAPASPPPSAKVVGPMSDALMEEAIRVLIGQPGDPIAKAAMKVLSRDKAALRRVASETTVAGRTRALCDTLEAKGWHCVIDAGALKGLFTPEIFRKTRALCRQAYDAGMLASGEMQPEHVAGCLDLLGAR